MTQTKCSGSFLGFLLELRRERISFFAELWAEKEEILVLPPWGAHAWDWAWAGKAEPGEERHWILVHHSSPLGPAAPEAARHTPGFSVTWANRFLFLLFKPIWVSVMCTLKNYTESSFIKICSRALPKMEQAFINAYSLQGLMPPSWGNCSLREKT